MVEISLNKFLMLCKFFLQDIMAENISENYQELCGRKIIAHFFAKALKDFYFIS